MTELTTADILRSRWDPAQGRRAIRLCVVLGVTLGLATVGAAIASTRWMPVALIWLAIVLGLSAAGALATAAAIRFHRELGRLLSRFAFVVFLKCVIILVLLVWAHALLFDYVQAMITDQTRAQAEAYTSFGGELTIAEIESHLLTASERANGVAPDDGRWAFVAYPLWPLQFLLVRDLIKVVGLLGFINILAVFAIWWERKVAGRIQSRLGPMRVGGWHGWAQSAADGLKLVQKEDITPAGADRALFKLAPYLAFVPVVAAFLAMPFGAKWVFRDLDVALLFILAMVGIDVIGVILGGWASNNKWSVFGAMREAAQMVSYEIPMGMSLLVPVMAAGALSLSRIGEIQGGGFHTWLVFANPFTFVAAFTYFIASLASCKRAPFDLPEAESELVAGYHTEYSGFRWALFFFGEYAAMFVVSGLAVVLFFGAWHSPLPVQWQDGWSDGVWWQRGLSGILFSGPIWFIAKAFFLLYVQMWMRWTLPRVRIDQVIYACIQVMVPMTMLLLLGNAIWMLLVPAGGVVGLGVNLVLTAIGALAVLGFLSVVMYGLMNRERLVGSLVVRHLPGA
jgi:NADH-quinone oxidoreductase subunit H